MVRISFDPSPCLSAEEVQQVGSWDASARFDQPSENDGFDHRKPHHKHHKISRCVKHEMCFQVWINRKRFALRMFMQNSKNMMAEADTSSPNGPTVLRPWSDHQGKESAVSLQFLEDFPENLKGPLRNHGLTCFDHGFLLKSNLLVYRPQKIEMCLQNAIDEVSSTVLRFLIFRHRQCQVERQVEKPTVQWLISVGGGFFGRYSRYS